MKQCETLTPSIEGKINYATLQTPSEVDGYVQEQVVESRTVSVLNARTTEKRPSLMSEGFELIQAPVVFSSSLSDEEIRTTYPTIEKQLKQQTLAKEIFIFDHTIRSSIHGKSKRKPIHLTHADYAKEAGLTRLRNLLPNDYTKWEDGHFLIVNMWQSISGTILSSPLAFVDIRTVHDDDLKTIKVVYENRTGRIGYYQYSPRHQWYWFPLLKNSEALLFKTFDSMPGSQHWSCPHTAFRHNSESTNSERSSIEFRILLLLSEETN